MKIIFITIITLLLLHLASCRSVSQQKTLKEDKKEYLLMEQQKQLSGDFKTSYESGKNLTEEEKEDILLEKIIFRYNIVLPKDSLKGRQAVFEIENIKIVKQNRKQIELKEKQLKADSTVIRSSDSLLVRQTMINKNEFENSVTVYSGLWKYLRYLFWGLTVLFLIFIIRRLYRAWK